MRLPLKLVAQKSGRVWTRSGGLCVCLAIGGGCLACFGGRARERQTRLARPPSRITHNWPIRRRPHDRRLCFACSVSALVARVRWQTNLHRRQTSLQPALGLLLLCRASQPRASRGRAHGERRPALHAASLAPELLGLGAVQRWHRQNNTRPVVVVASDPQSLWQPPSIIGPS